MINKQLLQKRFSRNAKNYDRYANIQKRMAHQLIDLIKLKKNDMDEEIRILDIGCGTGYLTKQLINIFPLANITALDIAPGMIEVAQKRLGQKKVNFLCGDIEEMEIDGKYDLITSNATFQWFNYLDKTVEKLYKMLHNKGTIYFSTFGKYTFTELHQSYERAKKSLELKTDVLPGQIFYSLDNLYDLCRHSISRDNSLSSVNGYESFEYEYFNSVKDFLDSIKKVGANNSNQERNSNSISLLKEMIKIYETYCRENNKIKATYHCLFLSLEKR